MIKEALQYIVGLNQPNQIERDGELFVDKTMHRVHPEINTDHVCLSTLTSLLDYLKGNAEVFFENKMIVHVVSPTRVDVYTQTSERFNLISKLYLRVEAETPEFRFDRWYDNESFVINVQSKFKDTKLEELADGILNDKPTVLQFAGTVQDGTVADYGDTGVTQSATIKTGILNAEDKVIPNPVTLIPFRTFKEVEQPASQFIFRMRSDNGVQCALYEADGGAWKNEAMQNVKRYLQAEIEAIKMINGKDFIVIA